MSVHIAAIILAAGEGIRFGGSTALVRMEGRTWLQIAVERIVEAGFDTISVVLGAGAEAISEPVAGLARELSTKGIVLRFDLNDCWMRGRTGSISWV
jgi:CTP:molybdopterin cytidylyltransferase MocA